MFIFPIAGTLIVLGPLSGFIAGAIGGAGIAAMSMALPTIRTICHVGATGGTVGAVECAPVLAHKRNIDACKEILHHATRSS